MIRLLYFICSFVFLYLISCWNVCYIPCMFVCLCVSMFHLLSITGLSGDCWAVKTFREKKVNLSKQGCWVWHRLVISILSKISFFIHKRLWSWFSNTLETFHTFHTCHTCHTLLSVQRRCHTFPNLSLLVVLQTRRKLVNEFAYQQLSSHLQLGDLHFNTTYDIEERSEKLEIRIFFLVFIRLSCVLSPCGRGEGGRCVLSFSR